MSTIVEARKSGLRTRSRYSRRATIAAFGKSGSRSPIRPRLRPGATTSRPRAPGVAISSAGRPTCSMNSASRLGSATSNRVTERPRARTAGEDDGRVGAGRQLELAAAGDGTDPVDARQLGQPGRRRRRRRPPAGACGDRWPASGRGPGRRRPAGRGRRSRPIRTAPRRPPSGGSRRRASGRGRAARGTPRAGARG